MDINLFSKMVKELVLENDQVALPGLGAFVAEVVPSTFSDRGYTINPPYRRLSFKLDSSEDTLLADFYAKNNKVDASVASQVISNFVKELGESLKASKAVQFPGLGRLRMTKDGNVFFIADEDLDIYPAGFGLEPISLKSHSKPTSFDFDSLGLAAAEAPAVAETPATAETPAAVDAPAEAVAPVEAVAPSEEVPSEEPSPSAEEPVPAEDAEPIAEPVAEPVAEPEPAEAEPVEEPVAEPVEEPAAEPEPAEPSPAQETAEEAKLRAEREYFGVQEEDYDEDGHHAGRGFLIALIVLLIIAALVVAGFFFMVEYYPDILDRFLYTTEELEILNYIK